MKTVLKTLPVALAALSVSLSGCDKKPAKAPEPAAAAPENAPESPGGIVKLDAATRERIGLKTEVVKSVYSPAGYEAVGTVADPSGLVALAAEIAPAKIARDVSRLERDRLLRLSRAGNASLRSVQAAEAACARDELAFESGRTRLALAWGDAFAASDDPVAAVAPLARRERALIRLELPVGVVPPSGVRSAVVASVNDPETGYGATFAEEAPSASGASPGRAYFFMTGERVPGFVPGAPVVGRILGAGTGVAAPVVPESALIRADGKTFVYLAAGEDGFRRIEVVPGRAAATGRFVAGEIKAGDRVVVAGAAQLSGKETGAGGGE